MLHIFNRLFLNSLTVKIKTKFLPAENQTTTETRQHHQKRSESPPSPSHAHLLAHLVSEAFLPVTQLVPVLLPQFVPPPAAVGTVGVSVVMSLFLGAVLAVTFAPLGFIFAAHELVKLVVVSLSFPLLVFPSVILVSLSAAMLLSLLLVALRLPPAGQRRESSTFGVSSLFNHLWKIM